MQTITDISPYCKIIDRKSKDTLILFSPVNTPEGKFAYYSFGMNTKENVIFLNTKNNHWYYDGVPGLGEGHLATISQLKKTISELGDRNVICIGGSMGGYGALMYGALIKNVNKVIAFGPELELNIKGGLSSRNLKGTTYKYLNLPEQIINNPKNYTIIVGENNITDLFGVAKLYKNKTYYIKIYSLKNLMHNIPPYIKKKFGIDTFLSKILYKDYLEIFDQEELGCLFKEYELVNFIYKCHYYTQDIDEEVALSWENKMDKYPFYVQSYLSNALGLFYKNRKKYDKAQYFFEFSVKNNSSNILFRLNLIENEDIMHKIFGTFRRVGNMCIDALEDYNELLASQDKYRASIEKILAYMLKSHKTKIILKFLYKHELHMMYKEIYTETIKLEYAKLYDA